MQHSAEYIAYKKLMARKKRLFLGLVAGSLGIMFGVTLLAPTAASYVTFPLLIVGVVIWRMVYAQNDTCPWCGKGFSEGTKSRPGFGHVTGMGSGIRCSSCGQPE